MKRNRIIAFALALAAVLSLCACGGTEKVRDDVSVETLVSDVMDAIGKNDESLRAMDKGYIQGYMGLEVDSYAGYAVYKNAIGANIDEFGIFKAESSSQAKEIKSDVQDYLKMLIAGWMEEYMPLEKPKLTSAKVNVVGNYVTYFILSEDDVKSANNTVDSVLKG